MIDKVMANQKIYMLRKSLPKCPAGRYFKSTVDGTSYYHAMTDEEHISDKYLSYKFTTKEVEEDPEWFTRVDNFDSLEAQLHYLTDCLNHIKDVGQTLKDQIAEVKRKIWVETYQMEIGDNVELYRKGKVRMGKITDILATSGTVRPRINFYKVDGTLGKHRAEVWNMTELKKI